MPHWEDNQEQLPLCGCPISHCEDRSDEACPTCQAGNLTEGWKKEIVPLSIIPHKSGIQERDFGTKRLAMTRSALFRQPHKIRLGMKTCVGE
jgi:hypothetical protein